MKFIILNVSCLFFFISSYCDKNTPIKNQSKKGSNNTHTKNAQMTIKIGSKTFEALLYDNATATAFKALLPLTINMIELNDNEKYSDLKGNLPINSFNPKTIQNGDLMIYGSNTLVLFYKTLSTPYSYTKLGSITDTTGLAEALGSDNILISFELN